VFYFIQQWYDEKTPVGGGGEETIPLLLRVLPICRKRSKWQNGGHIVGEVGGGGCVSREEKGSLWGQKLKLTMSSISGEGLTAGVIG
jgi:hypothetical protein